MHLQHFMVWYHKFYTCTLENLSRWTLKVVCLKNGEKHVAHMSKVRKIDFKYWLYTKWFKYDFAKDELYYLDHVVDQNRVKIDLAIFKTIMPCDFGKLCSFVELCHYIRIFFQGYSTLVAPLTNLFRHDSKFNWIVDCQFDLTKWNMH